MAAGGHAVLLAVDGDGVEHTLREHACEVADAYTELTSATRPLRAYAWVDEPTNVCQTSGGSPACSREASTTETLLPPPPATAPSTTVTPLCAAL